MKKIIKQVVGIDVAQDELVVCLGRMDEDYSPVLITNKSFANRTGGFKAMVAWVKRFVDPSKPVCYVMEATGVYHESLAYYLDDLGAEVTVVLPNKISNYFKTLDIKTVTDKTASEAITRFGLERKLDTWHRPKMVYRVMGELTRERDQLIDERTVIKNQIHAEKAGAFPNPRSLKRFNVRINILDKQEAEIQEELLELVSSEPELKERVKRLCTLTGVGMLTAITVLGETRGFTWIRNKSQLTSYAGLDVKEKLSGTSVKGKPRISKKGNRHLRKAMYFPAISAVQHDERFKNLYERLHAKHGIKMKAYVAVQRKLLELMYILDKNKSNYDKNYLTKEMELVLNS